MIFISDNIYIVKSIKHEKQKRLEKRYFTYQIFSTI
jgi:hypothetical protein